MFTCEACGKRFGNEFYDSFADYDVCKNCMKFLRDTIHPYSYTPELDFKGHSKLHVGVELEIQADTVRELSKFLKHVNHDYFYIKRDGSLDDLGIEIVSMPLTFDIIKGKPYKTLYKYLNAYNITDTCNCGLHFHLDRQYFNPITTAKIDYICNTYNVPISVFGGRLYDEDSEYCRTLSKWKEDYGRAYDDRYVACNLENDNTIELRFCKSTHDYNKFIERVNLIENIVKITNEYSLDQLYNLGDDDFADKLNGYMNKKLAA